MTERLDGAPRVQRERQCAECDVTFRPLSPNGRYCTPECQKAHYKERCSQRWPERTCEECGELFKVLPTRPQQRFCSKRCRAYWQARVHPQPKRERKPRLERLPGQPKATYTRQPTRISKVCPECGEPYMAKRGQKVCSRACRAQVAGRAIGKMLLDTGDGKSYRKRGGRHEHRVIAEEVLGRSLRLSEVVHHVDENPRNNDPSNLIVFPSQAAHAAHHAALRRGRTTATPPTLAQMQAERTECH